MSLRLLLVATTSLVTLSLFSASALAADTKAAAPAAKAKGKGKDKDAAAKADPAADANKPSAIGYNDTPLIVPGGSWKVHDIDRPRPAVVTPGKTAADAPADAVVIFDGTDSSKLSAKAGGPCPWLIENGELVIQGGDVMSNDSFGSCQVHIEWKSDPNTGGNSQKKGNAGIFLMDRYEVQMLDCYENPTYADGMAGGIYGQTPPLVNAVRKPGEWQVYDIIFSAPKLDGGKVIEPAYLTVIINGILVQNHTPLLGPTFHKKATNYEGTFPERAPFRLQDHKNTIPNRFRNIWLRHL